MRPRILDLFCGAGGAAKGYQRAGFYVVGVDIEPQPNYCGDNFWQVDAFQALGPYWWPDGQSFDAIHASPPCQHHANVTRWRGDQDDHPELIGPTRELLDRIGLPYVIENVEHAPLHGCFVLCGSMFGLPIRRHRYFETSWRGFSLVPPHRHSPEDHSFDHGGKQPESVYRDAMGCGWMTVQESREAIPPVYTEFIGAQLLAHLKAERRAA